MRDRISHTFQRQGKKAWLLIAFGVVAAGLLGGGVYATLGGSPRPQTTADIELQRGLIGWWKMDGNAKDSSPYGNHGTATAVSLTTDRKAKANSAYLFNSASDIISVPYTATHWPPNAISVSVWFKPANMAKTTVQNIIGNQQNGGFDLLINADGAGNCPAGLKWVMEVNGSQRSNCIAKTIFTDGIWYHIAGTYDGTDIKLYVDGVLQDTDNWPGTLTYSSTTTPLCMGLVPGSTDCSGGNMVGTMDDVRLYNRALSQAEVTTLHKSYDPGLRAATGQNGLVGWWKLNGNAKDSSPYVNHGTLSGPTAVADHEGHANGAYSFNGSSTTLTIPYSAAFNPTATMSVGVWFKSGPNPSSSVERIVSNLDSGGYGLYMTYPGTSDDCGASNLCWKVRVNGSYQLVSTPITALTNGNWYYLAGTYDGTFLRLYINGSLIATSASFPGSIGTNTSALCIGAAPTGSVCDSNYLKNSAVIDDVRIYNRVLSGTEIATSAKFYNSQVSVSSLQSGLVGYWPLNGNAKDITPYHSNGTVTNAVLTTDRKTRANSAYAFDGTGDFIRATSTSLPASTAAQTVIAWVNPSTFASIKNIVYITNSTPNQELRFRIAATARLQISNSAGAVASSAGSLTTGTWYQVAYTWDGSNTRFYINGALDAAPPDPTAIQASSAIMNTVSIGEGTSSAQDFEGSIDDVRIYNRALSDSEIASLYRSYN